MLRKLVYSLFLLILSSATDCIKRSPIQTQALRGCLLDLASVTPDSYINLSQTAGINNQNTITSVAQSFTLDQDSTLSAVIQLWVKKIQRPGSTLFVSIQNNVSGIAGDIPAFVGLDPVAVKKLVGLPDGKPVVGGRFQISDINNDNEPERITIELDHGTLSLNQRTQERKLASSTPESLFLKKGTYWIVVDSEAPLNGTDYIQIGTYLQGSTLSSQTGTHLITSNISSRKRIWSFAQTGVIRDMSFSIGCPNN